VTGRFAGTTDEILQWAALKWGIRTSVARAVAVKESNWDQATVGDAGASFGLMQVKYTNYTGTYPLSRLSTAFNADLWASEISACYDGRYRWLNTVRRGRRYHGHDLWGCLGYYFAGRWYTPAADEYVGDVRRILAARTWRRPSFVGGQRAP
jgi:autotransporter family porin